MVSARRWPAPVQHDHRFRRDGLTRPGRAGGRPVHRQGPARAIQCRAGREDRAHSRRTVARRRDPGRHPRNPRAQGPRPGRLVIEGGRPSPEDVQTVAIVGAGVIGAGWAAHFLRMGYDVVAWDPGPGAAERLTALVEGAWPALERLGLRQGASRDRLRLAEIDAVTPPDVVIGSSTSGLMMSEMAARTKAPERFVVGHPFNPPYLIPLVEIVGGQDTDPAAVTWAEKFYTCTGKVCLTMDHEVPGFVGNRLQEALWREALHMIDSGQATVQQIDDSITYGPGLRWALMGPMLTFHLAGGHGGMAHMLDHFGPALLEPWTRLTAPALTPRLRDLVVAGVDRAVGDTPIGELEQQRDEFLADLLLLLAKHRRA